MVPNGGREVCERQCNGLRNVEGRVRLGTRLFKLS